MSLNYLILCKQIKFSDMKIKKDAKLKQTLRKPHIFQHIMSFLDDDTIFEINWVCKLFSKNIKNQMELHYKVLNLKDEKNKKKKRNQKEFYESVEKSKKANKDNKYMFALFFRSAIPQYDKLVKDKSKAKSIEKVKSEETVIKENGEIEEFLETIKNNFEEAELRKRKYGEISGSLEFYKKDSPNGVILYQSIPGTVTNNFMNAVFNIVKETGTAKMLMTIDPFELYYGIEKIMDKVDEKMFDFDMKVTEFLFKIKYQLKKKEFPLKSLK